MSEFSDSYHLKTANPTEAVELLKRSGLKGYVFPESNGWVTLVAEGSEFDPNEQLIAANKGIILHYACAEDHGWFFSIYQGDKRVSHYECIWEEELEVNDTELNKDLLIKLIEEPTGKVNLEEIEAFLHPEEIEEIFENPVYNRFAEEIGLQYFEWLSYSYYEDVYESGDEIFEGVIVVD